MPNRDIHNLICELAGINPKIANQTNHMMDLPSQIMGSQHRKLFHGQHTRKIKTPIGTIEINDFRMEPKDMVELYALTGFNPDAVKAWLLHLMADGVAGRSVHLYSKGTKSKKSKTSSRKKK